MACLKQGILEIKFSSNQMMVCRAVLKAPHDNICPIDIQIQPKSCIIDRDEDVVGSSIYWLALKAGHSGLPLQKERGCRRSVLTIWVWQIYIDWCRIMREMVPALWWSNSSIPVQTSCQLCREGLYLSMAQCPGHNFGGTLVRRAQCPDLRV